MNKEKLVNMTLEELGKRYPLGLYEFLYINHKDLYKQLQEIEDKIDNAFLFENEQDLKLVLKDYWTFHMKAIQLFKNNRTMKSNLADARKEMLDERIRA